MTVYPYIGDKQMYAAVDHACAKYGVDREELEAHVKARTAAGQRMKCRVRKAQRELAA